MVTQINYHRLITALAFLSLLLTSPSWAINKLTTSVDRNPVMERESFILEVIADGSVNTNDLDLSPISRSGLTMGRTSTSSQTQIINGNISKTTTWSVVLVARNAGTYTIPALEVDGVKSQPLEVQVVKPSNNQGDSSQPIFIKNQLEQSELYLQQSVKLVTRLNFSSQVELQSGSLTEPKLDSAFIKQQGKDKDTSDIVNGIRYRVIERVYTITPQSSGRFTLQSPTFNGEVATGNRRRSLFSTFGQSKPVTIFGDDIELNVLPIPENYAGTWLASELVQINEEWQPDKNEFEVGEAITRTFTLTALNVNEEQLPEIKGQYPQSFKVYPDKSEAHSVLRQNALVSQRISSEALVANKAGSYTLPEVSVSWFNTKTKRQQRATIPARTVTIIPSSVNPSSTMVASSPSSTLTNDQPIVECPAPTELATTNTETPPTATSLTTLGWLGWLAWLTTMIIWLITHLLKRRTKVQAEGQMAAKFDLSTLKTACKNNDAKTALQQIQLWLKFQFNCESISAGRPHLTEQLNQEIDLLNQARFSSNPTEWRGQSLWQAMSTQLKTKTTNTEKDDLPSLY